MKALLKLSAAPAVLAAALWCAPFATAQSVWNATNNVSANTNWSTAANWTPSGVPGASTTVTFNDATEVTDTSINSVVDGGLFAGTISSLTFGHTNTAEFQNVLIPTGVTLNVTGAGGLLVGSTALIEGTAATLVTTFSGPGKLSVNNSSANVNVGIAQPSTSGAAILNLTNLDSFSFTGARLMVGVAGAARTSGTLYLAKTNAVTLTGSSPQLDVGDNGGNNGPGSTLFLGQTNSIYADNIAMGRAKQNSGGGGSIRFNPAFTNLNPAAYFRGHDGVAPVATWNIADGGTGGGTITDSGTTDFSGGTVDAVVTAMWLAKNGTGANASSSANNATLTFSAGTISVGTLTNAALVSSARTPTVTATLNVNGTGKLSVGSTLAMAALNGFSGTATGTLNVNGGTVQANTIVAGGGSSTINMVGGALFLTNTAGSPTTPLTSFSVSDSTLQLALPSVSTVPIHAANVTADGQIDFSNIINVVSLPTIVSFPTTLTLIQSDNAIALTQGNFNFLLGTLPAGYTGSIIQSPDFTKVQLYLTGGPIVTTTWTGADLPNHNTNWSDGVNWSGALPGASSVVIFNAAASQSASALSTPGGGPGALIPSRINNIVDSSFVVTGVNYTNVNGTYENTFINNNASLKATPAGIIVGSQTQDFGDTTGNVTISGPGALTVTNNASTIYVGLGTQTGGATPRVTLDMSALGSFNATVGNLLVGVGGYSAGGFTLNQPAGTLYLAQTNIITAASSTADTSDSTPVALEVGDADTQAGTVPSTLYLGLTNAIFADNLAFGRQLGTGVMRFNPAVVGGGGPSALFRGASGAAVSSWTIGDGVISTLSVSASGTNDFSGGSVDALVNTMYVGKSSPATLAGTAASGTLTFNAGTINVNTLNVGYNNTNSDGNVYGYATGTVIVNGAAKLTVNTNLTLAFTPGPLVAGGLPAGTLNVTNGAVWANTIVAGANGATSAINISGGALTITNTAGSAAAPLSLLYVSNATLNVGLTNLQTPVTVTSLTVDGPAGVHNAINVLSLPAIASYPVNFTIIQSVNAMTLAGGGFNFSLASLPAGYAGTLSESVDQKAVVLSVSSGPVGVRPSMQWTGADVPNLNTNWSDRLNWQLPGAPVGPENIIFNNGGVQNASSLSTPGGGVGALLPDNIDNMVDNNFTVGSLTYTNLGANYHNTALRSGVALTLTNTGSLTIGALDSGPTALQDQVNISGPNGSLVVANTNGNLLLFLGSGSAVTSQAVLDLSALGTFNASVSRLLVGATVGNSVNRPSGILYLARTNILTTTFQTTTTEAGTTTANAGIVAADCNANPGATSFIYLGLTNSITADTLAFGRQKASGVLQFNPIYTNIAPLPELVLQGFSSSRVSIFDVGDGVGNTGTTTLQGTADLSGGRVTAMVDTLNIGRASSGSGSGNTAGALTFDAGTINVNTMNIGLQPASGTKAGLGTNNVNANPAFGAVAMLMVNGNLGLGVSAGGAGAASTVGVLNITNGIVQANTIVAGTNGSISTIDLEGGTLVVSNTAGTPEAPLTALTLAGGTLQFNINGNAARTNLVATTITASGTTTINIGAIANQGSSATIPLISYTGADPFANLLLGSLPTGYSGTLMDNHANSTIDLSITPPPTLTWVGAIGSTLDSSWDFGTHNWKDGGAPSAYANPDYVVFDDSASNGIVTLATVSPGGVTVSNNALSYTFGGTGKITGPSGFLKSGSSTLKLTETGGDNFSGGLSVSNGTLILDNPSSAVSGGSAVASGATLQVGNNDANGLLPSGSVAMNGTLVFTQIVNQTVGNVISGAGTLIQGGANVLTLTVSNSYTGPTIILPGSILRVDNNFALGTTNGGTTINPGGTLDVGAPDLAANALVALEPLTVSGAGVSGNGAIINSSTNQQFNALRFVTLAGNTAFGGLGPWNALNGNPGRWDIRGSSSAGSNGVLSTSSHPYSLIKTGFNQVSIVGTTVDSALGNIDVQQGLLGFEGGTTSMGNPASNLIVRAGAAISFFNSTNLWNKVFALNGNGTTVTVTNWSGSNIVVGPVTLVGSCLFGVSSNAQLMLTNNTLGGAGSLTKISPGVLVLAGTNTYTGSTTVSEGTLSLVGGAAIPPSPVFDLPGTSAVLDLNRAGGVLVLGSGQTLRGVGTVWASVTNAPGSTNAPGESIGMLTISSNVVLQGTTVMELDKSNPATNDVLSSPGIILGGTLVVTNLNPGLPPLAGDTFRLFNAASYSGTFSVTKLPGLAAGLAWDTTQLGVSGILSVVTASTPPPSPGISNFLVSAGNLIFRGTATNSLANKTYYVRASTNAALPRSAWTFVATNSFDAFGGFAVTNGISPGTRSQFYLIDIPWPQ